MRFGLLVLVFLIGMLGLFLFQKVDHSAYVTYNAASKKFEWGTASLYFLNVGIASGDQNGSATDFGVGLKLKIKPRFRVKGCSVGLENLIVTDRGKIIFESQKKLISTKIAQNSGMVNLIDYDFPKPHKPYEITGLLSFSEECASNEKLYPVNFKVAPKERKGVRRIDLFFAS